MNRLDNECAFSINNHRCSECNEYYCCSLIDYIEEHDAALIDELARRINQEIHLSYSDDLNIQDHINAIAEQMKGWKNA